MNLSSMSRIMFWLGFPFLVAGLIFIRHSTAGDWLLVFGIQCTAIWAAAVGTSMTLTTMQWYFDRMDEEERQRAHRARFRVFTETANRVEDVSSIPLPKVGDKPGDFVRRTQGGSVIFDAVIGLCIIVLVGCIIWGQVTKTGGLRPVHPDIRCIDGFEVYVPSQMPQTLLYRLDGQGKPVPCATIDTTSQ